MVDEQLTRRKVTRRVLKEFPFRLSLDRTVPAENAAYMRIYRAPTFEEALQIALDVLTDLRGVDVTKSYVNILNKGVN